MGSLMGNLAAAYCGLPEVRVHSGGTAPTAFNVRTITALQAIGFEIAPTGRSADPGAAGADNPIYRAAWGDGLETLEFSKRYAHPSNPREGFAAVLV